MANKKLLVLSFMAVVIFSLTGCSKDESPSSPAPTPVTTVTQSFQAGLSGYSGSKDTSVNNYYPGYNYGTDTTLFVGVHGTNDECERTLMKFDVSSIDSSAVVVSAQLDFTLNNNLYPITVTAYPLGKEWTEGTSVGGDYGADCTWINANTSDPWGSSGGDFNAANEIGNAYYYGVATDGRVTMQLNASAVNGWISNPSSNHGFILKLPVEPSVSRFLVLYSEEHATAAYRPELKINYYIP